jgi:hypothetical protein
MLNLQVPLVLIVLSQNRSRGRSPLAYTTERWSACRYRVARFSGRTLKRSPSQFRLSGCLVHLVQQDHPNKRNRPEKPVHLISVVWARSQSVPQPVSDRDPTNAGQPTPSFVLCGIKDSANCARVRWRRLLLSNEQTHIPLIHLVFISDVGIYSAATIGTFLAFPLPYFMIDAALRKASRNRTPLKLNETTGPYRRYP